VTTDEDEPMTCLLLATKRKYMCTIAPLFATSEGHFTYGVNFSDLISLRIITGS